MRTSCSRTDVIRKALRELDRIRAERRASLDRFLSQLFSGVPEGSAVMIGLDDSLQPFVTIDGQTPRPDIPAAGDQITLSGEDYVRVVLIDPDTDLRLVVGAIKASRRMARAGRALPRDAYQLSQRRSMRDRRAVTNL